MGEVFLNTWYYIKGAADCYSGQNIRECEAGS